MEKNVEVGIDFNKEAFFSNGLTVSHSKYNFFLEFRQLVTRYSQIYDKPLRKATIKHNLVVVNIEFIKVLVKTLMENIKQYEERFGKIEEPKMVKRKKEPEKDESVSTSYIG